MVDARRRRWFEVWAGLAVVLALGTGCGRSLSDAQRTPDASRRVAIARVLPGEDEDLAVISAMRRAGIDLSRARRVNFHAYAPTQRKAVSLQDLLQAAGFEASYDDSGQGDFLVTGSEVMVVDLPGIRREEARFAAVVLEAGDSFDGWEAATDPA
jgi:hypothetical protein